jgi:hypothetical protein
MPRRVVVAGPVNVDLVGHRRFSVPSAFRHYGI